MYNITYYGKTFKTLLSRCNEHLGINKSESKLANPNPLSIGDHIKQTGHSASLDDLHIVSRTDNTFDFLMHENFIIQKDRPMLNSQQSSFALVLF